MRLRALTLLAVLVAVAVGYAVLTIAAAMDRQYYEIECLGVPYDVGSRPDCVEVEP